MCLERGAAFQNDFIYRQNEAVYILACRSQLKVYFNIYLFLGWMPATASGLT